MQPKYRSLTGMAIAIVSMPVILGLLACLPVPLGDPEKSRIDPDLSGMWIMDGESIVLMEPFDKRSWLLTMVNLINDVDECGSDEGSDEDDEEDDYYTSLVNRIERLGASCFTADAVSLFKAWRVRLGGEWFMTWEVKGHHDDEYGFASEFWYGFRIEKSGSDEFSLWMIDGESYEGFDDLDKLELLKDMDPPYDSRALKKARRAVERVIARNVDDEELYDDSPWVFHRVEPEHHDMFESFLDDVVGIE